MMDAGYTNGGNLSTWGKSLMFTEKISTHHTQAEAKWSNIKLSKHPQDTYILLTASCYQSPTNI